ncbi:hypothetical protein ACFWPV_16380 [Streptomyces uncialis]|uniref:hypothetical protein n=1 Tax=Streptomyces uncialis TaxID=1048205 RepID=UPI0036656EA9
MDHPFPGRHSSRVPARLRRLLICVLSGLLLATVHCSTPAPGDHHEHAVTVTAVAELTQVLSLETSPGQSLGESGHPPHHGDSSCFFPAGIPQILSEVQLNVGAEGTPPLAPTDRPAAAAAPPLPPDSARPRTDRSGRSTLTSICRWRV